MKEFLVHSVFFRCSSQSDRLRGRAAFKTKVQDGNF